MSALDQTLSAFMCGSPQHASNLCVVPLLSSAAVEANYLTLDEALGSGAAEVTEISESGSVPTLLFRNSSHQDILLVDGEQLIGARQNRVVNLSILVPAETDLPIPVSCVERSRWGYNSRKFSSSGGALHARGRSSKLASVSLSMASRRTPSSDQVGLWNEISRKLDRMKVDSMTEALAEAYSAHREALEAYRAMIRLEAGQVGAAFLVNHRLLGIDFFDATSTFSKLMPKFVDSYAMDALEAPVSEFSRDEVNAHSIRVVEQFLNTLRASRAKEYLGTGRGKDIRLEGPGVHGAALLHDDRIVHMAAYAE